jgi:hypothetical protein
MPYRLDESTGLIDYDQVIFPQLFLIYGISLFGFLIIFIYLSTFHDKVHAFLCLSALSVKRAGFLLHCL